MAPDRKPSLATVAGEAGVSTATVSHAFNRPDRVSAQVRERVLAVARRQGYAGPHPAARQLSRGTTDTLGVLLTQELAYAFRDPAATQFIEGLATTCQTAGLNLLLIATESSGDSAGMVGAAAVDGFVVYSVPSNDPHLRRILDRRLPTVIVDSPADVPGVDWVGVDDRAGGRMLGQHLVGLGHRRIGVITTNVVDDGRSGPRDSPGGRVSAVREARIAGLREVLDANGIVDLPIEDRPDNTMAAGADALDVLLDRCPDLTAVCALMDVLAIGALDAARRRGLVVPRDLSVTGFDGIPQATGVGLTTVAQPLVEKGRVAGELVLSQRPGTPARRRRLPVRLAIGGTSSRPP